MEKRTVSVLDEQGKTIGVRDVCITRDITCFVELDGQEQKLCLVKFISKEQQQPLPGETEEETKGETIPEPTSSIRCSKCHEFYRTTKAGGPCPKCDTFNRFDRKHQQSYRKEAK